MTNEAHEGSRDAEQQTTSETETTDDRSAVLGRRGALKMAGTAVVGASALGSAGTAAAASYETITVDSHSTKIISVGQWDYPPGEHVGDTMENVLIDATASGAEVRIKAHGDDWAIRNMAIRGEQTNPHYTILATANSGGTGRIENCWFGDGSGQEFLYVHRNHAGTIEVRDCYIADSDTGIYASPAAPQGMHGSSGNGGETHVENCYLKDISYTHFLMGSDGDSVRGCVADSPNQAEYQVVGYNRWQDVSFVDCDIRTGGGAFKSGNTTGSNTGYGADTTVRNCRVDADGHLFGGPGSYSSRDVSSNPDLTPPSGVPTSAQEAVSGSSGGSSASSVSSSSSSDSGSESDSESSGDSDSSSDSDSSDSSGGSNELVVDGSGSSSVTDYDFTVSGSVSTMDSPHGDSASGNEASGSTYGWKDGYEFSGDVEELNVSAVGGDIEVEVDGSNGTIEVSSAGGTDEIWYDISVSGDLERGDYASKWDRTDGSSVHGSVMGGGWDTFSYSGEIESIDLADGSTVVTIE